MKKILALLLAVALGLTVLPAFAESSDSSSGLSGLLDGLLGGASEGGDSSSLDGLLNGLLGGASEGGDSSSLEGLLNGLLGGASEGEGGSSLSGLLDGLKGGLGKLSGKLPALIYFLKDTLKREIAKAGLNTKFSEIISGIMGKFTAASSKASEGAESSGGLAALLGRLLSGASENLPEGDSDQWLAEYQSSPAFLDEAARDAAIEAYILEEYKDDLEAGDVQIVCIGSGIDDEAGDGVYKYLRNFSLGNYTADGTSLIMKNYASTPELLILTRGEDGAYQVTEAVQAEDGEKYQDSIAAMCEQYGTELETVTINLNRKEGAEAYNLAAFLRSHPEYEKVEYGGELLTAEELDAIGDAAFEQLLSDINLSGIPGLAD